MEPHQNGELQASSPQVAPKRKHSLPRRDILDPDRLATRKPWVKSSGPPETLFRRAAYYLSAFDYKAAAVWDLDTPILLHVVCNLRNYYQQDADQTVRLISWHFNSKSWEVWSPEAVRLAWELVEPYTPSLGLTDEDARSRQRVAEIEDEVTDLIAYTRSGGEVSVEKLFALYQEWFPDREIDRRLFGKAVNAVTGIKSKPKNGRRSYVGFHLPTEDELDDPAHSPDAAPPIHTSHAFPQNHRAAA